MDKIIIKELEVFAYHGVLPEEKERGQNFYVTVELFLNTRSAGQNDDLKYTINYAEVCDDIYETMTREKYNLIEAVAENIADVILIKYDLVKEIHINISKPHAPIDMEFKTVCVDIIRKKHIVYLGLGSNLGDKEGYLEYAVDQLNKDEYIKVNKVSTYIETEPYGNVDQDNFLNGCVEIETLYAPEELLHVVNDIEQGAGRTRQVHWGPRTLDIDILLYDSDVIMTDCLMIPHVEMTKRSFVLEPMCEIAPFVFHPVYNQTMLQLKEELQGI